MHRLEPIRRNHADPGRRRSRLLILATATTVVATSSAGILATCLFVGRDKEAIFAAAAGLAGIALGFAAGSSSELQRRSSLFQLSLKRALDITVSGMLLLTLAPLLATLAFLVKLQRPREGVLVAAARIGLHGRPMQLFAYRSSGRLGTLLQRSSIDELPMLYNVLVGDLSLVGPRPRRAAALIAGLVDLPASKPGLVQPLSGRIPMTSEDWVEIESEYESHWSVWKDVKILAGSVLRPSLAGDHPRSNNRTKNL